MEMKMEDGGVEAGLWMVERRKMTPLAAVRTWPDVKSPWVDFEVLVSHQISRPSHSPRLRRHLKTQLVSPLLPQKHFP